MISSIVCPLDGVFIHPPAFCGTALFSDSYLFLLCTSSLGDLMNLFTICAADLLVRLLITALSPLI